jgi:hypothetical protein
LCLMRVLIMISGSKLVIRSHGTTRAYVEHLEQLLGGN